MIIAFLSLVGIMLGVALIKKDYIVAGALILVLSILAWANLNV